MQNTRIHKNGKVRLRRGKVNIVRVKNPKTKLQKIRKKHTIKRIYANEILQKKSNCKKWKDNVKAENIQKICLSRKDSKSLKKMKVQLERGKVRMKYALL